MLRKVASSYLFRRLIKALVTIFVMASLTFFLIRLMPGGPVEAYITNLVTQYNVSHQSAVQQTASLFSLDLNAPIYQQYPEYMTGASDVVIKDWVSQEDLSNMDSYAYDPDAAASELEDLGFKKEGDVWVSPDGERMEYELGAPAEFADWSAAAKNLGDQLTKFGIKTTVRTVTFTQWEPRVLDGQFEMGIQAWGQGQPHPVYSFEHPLITYNIAASGGGISYDMTQETESYGEVDLEELIIQTASGLDEEDQKATVTKLSKIFNELLPVIPLWERYGNNPALDGERVTGWLPDSNPIYQNSPYEVSFTVMMIMDGTLKPAGQ